MSRRNLKGLDQQELQSFVESMGEKKYRAGQLFSWMYGKGASSFDEMTDISKEFRSLLNRTAALQNLELIRKNVSPTDGTTKFLYGLHDGLRIESVLIPAEESARPGESVKACGDSPAADRRLSLCISTQVGCPLDCKFCATGTMGFSRNLTAGEIVDQVIQAQRSIGRRITNLVYMGMGEPMLNYENVMKSVEIITDDRSLNIGARRVTISTAGYPNRIRQMADENRKVKLALSLHSLDNEVRTKLMPITKRHSVAELLEALEYYYRKTRQRPTFEYILFDEMNDSEEDIRRLVKASKRIPCKVNIIPFHSIAFTGSTGLAATLKAAPREQMEAFASALRRANITVMVRSSAGLDIEAACGQLAVLEAQADANQNAAEASEHRGPRRRRPVVAAR